jgi:hypothetical protein
MPTEIDLTKNDKKKWDKSTEEIHQFKLIRHKGEILEMEDVLFHFDSAVMMPEWEPEDPDYKNTLPYRISGINVLGVCYKHVEDNPSLQVLISGHTDTTGSESYNLKLSELRASNVLHALMGEKDAWVKVTLKKHQVEDYQQILKWVNRGWRWSCDPGEVDNRLGHDTKKAVFAFQVAYNKHFKKSIAEDGIAGKQTWEAFFDMYMQDLSQMLETDEKGLGKYRSKISFVKDNKKVVGCGKFFPVAGERKNRSPGAQYDDLEEEARDKYRSRMNRRVEILFFKPEHKPPLDCHPSAAKCLPEKCVINRMAAYTFKHIVVSPLPKIIWVDLQTVDEFGKAVPNVDLVLDPEFGEQKKDSSDENGYLGGRIRADGHIRVFLGDGETPTYFASASRRKKADETDKKKKGFQQGEAVFDPRIPTTSVRDIVVPSSLTDDEKKQRITTVQRFGRIPNHFRKTFRAGNTGKDEGEPTGEMSQRGRKAKEGVEVRMFRRTYGGLTADNLFIAAGWERDGNTDLENLIYHLNKWLKVNHPSALKKKYFVELVMYKNLFIISSDGKTVHGKFEFNAELSWFVFKGRFGAYSMFERYGLEFVDMNTLGGGLEPNYDSGQRKDEEKEALPKEDAPLPQEKIVPLYTLLREKDQKKYLKLRHGDLSGMIEVLYYLPSLHNSWLAMQGGTGLLENYSSGLSDDDRSDLHKRNELVAHHSKTAFESYIKSYIENVKKTKTDKELHELGPPLTQYIFPDPVGISDKEKKDISKALRTTSDYQAWLAISTHLCEIWGVRGDGDIWLKFEIEVDSGELLGKIIDVKWKWNWETTPEGNIKRTGNEVTAGVKFSKKIKGVDYSGRVEISGDPKSGPTEQKLNFGAGNYSFEYNVTTGEAKAGVGPFSISTNQEIKRLGFGVQLSTRELYKKFRMKQLKDGVPENKLINPEAIPAVTFGMGLQFQLLRESTVMAYLMGSPGIFEIRPVSELMKADWASLDKDEQESITILEWGLTLEEAIEKEPKLKPMLKYYPKNSVLWDLKRVLPYEYYPKSSKESWLKLSYAQKKASQKLLTALWGCEGNWKIFWLQFAPKSKKG